MLVAAVMLGVSNYFNGLLPSIICEWSEEVAAGDALCVLVSFRLGTLLEEITILSYDINTRLTLIIPCVRHVLKQGSSSFVGTGSLLQL